MDHPGAPASLTFDLREIPFSTRGSWLDLSPVTALHTTSDAVHLVSHRNGMHGVLRLEPVRGGEVVATTWIARESNSGPESAGPTRAVRASSRRSSTASRPSGFAARGSGSAWPTRRPR